MVFAAAAVSRGGVTIGGFVLRAEVAAGVPEEVAMTIVACSGGRSCSIRYMFVVLTIPVSRSSASRPPPSAFCAQM